MAEDLKKTVKAEETRIDITKDQEISYWSLEFGIHPDKIRQAVAAVGPDLKDIRKYLQK